jgi:DnaJ like chaperone protein
MSKKSYGKWIGGGLGWAFGGPIGGILGFAFGSMFDGLQKGQYAHDPYGASQTQTGSYKTQEGDFSISLLILSAAVMKADNRVLKSELDFVKKFFVQQFGIENANRNILMLKEILKQNINLIEVSRQIKRYMDYAAKLQLLHFLFGISKADGQLHVREIEIIDQIARYLDIDREDYLSIKAMFIKEVDSTYQILDVKPTATDDELKKAYYKMATKYHPDKVAHLGDEIKKAAEEKLQTLNAAYDEIKKQRGIK